MVVTGAGSGIGRAAAVGFAAEGASVACLDRDADNAESTTSMIRDTGGRSFAVEVDVRDEESVRAATAVVVDVHGGIDVLAANAGVNGFQTLHEVTVEDWDDMFAVNVRGVFLSIKHMVPYLIERAGSVVITGSAIQSGSRPGSAAYASSKSALAGLARAAALDYAAHGVRVNIVAPGTTDTSMVRGMSGVGEDDDRWPAMREAWGRDRMPGLQRMGTAAEVAAAVLMLASSDAAFITGTTLFVDGGMTAAL